MADWSITTYVLVILDTVFSFFQGTDGVEYLSIPLDSTALKQFLEETHNL